MTAKEEKAAKEKYKNNFVANRQRYANEVKGIGGENLSIVEHGELEFEIRSEQKFEDVLQHMAEYEKKNVEEDESIKQIKSAGQVEIDNVEKLLTEMQFQVEQINRTDKTVYETKKAEIQAEYDSKKEVYDQKVAAYKAWQASAGATGSTKITKKRSVDDRKVAEIRAYMKTQKVDEHVFNAVSPQAKRDLKDPRTHWISDLKTMALALYRNDKKQGKKGMEGEFEKLFDPLKTELDQQQIYNELYKMDGNKIEKLLKAYESMIASEDLALSPPQVKPEEPPPLEEPNFGLEPTPKTLDIIADKFIETRINLDLTLGLSKLDIEAARALSTAIGKDKDIVAMNDPEVKAALDKVTHYSELMNAAVLKADSLRAKQVEAYQKDYGNIERRSQDTLEDRNKLVGSIRNETDALAAARKDLKASIQTLKNTIKTKQTPVATVKCDSENQSVSATFKNKKPTDSEYKALTGSLRMIPGDVTITGCGTKPGIATKLLVECLTTLDLTNPPVYEPDSPEIFISFLDQLNQSKSAISAQKPDDQKVQDLYNKMVDDIHAKVKAKLGNTEQDVKTLAELENAVSRTKFDIKPSAKAVM